MQLKLSYLAWGALVVVALTGCLQNVDLFRVEADPQSGDSAGSPDRSSIALREKPGRQQAAEGYILTESGATPLYTLRDEYQVAPDGESWAFTLTLMDRPLTIVIYGDDGRIAATRSVAGPVFGGIPGGEFGVVSAKIDTMIVVSIPGSINIRAFQIIDDNPGASAEPRLRLVAVSTASPPGVSRTGVTEYDGLLVIGRDSQAGAWRHEEGGSVSWSVLLTADSRSISAPVDVTYRYAPVVDDRVEQPIVVPSVQLMVGTEEFELDVRPGVNRVVVYPEISDPRATEVTVISAVEGFEVVSIAAVGAGETFAPLPADLGTVFEYPVASWRDEQFELFRWTLFPEILVMDTLDYHVQSRFFKRLAFFVEKEGFRGQILSDAELVRWHGYNAHNYSGEGLSAFFNAAEGTGVDLTEQELLLRGILEREGIISRSAGRFEPGSGGIISISQESWRPAGLRHLLLTHEAYHGVYYAEAGYAEQIGELWRSLNDDERRYWGLFLDAMQYDVTDAYLVRNEFHAYLLQQPAAFAPWYFEEFSADRLRGWKPHEAEWLNGFLAENEGAFMRQALAANDILFSLTGLIGGDVFCLEAAIP